MPGPDLSLHRQAALIAVRLLHEPGVNEDACVRVNTQIRQAQSVPDLEACLLQFKLAVQQHDADTQSDESSSDDELGFDQSDNECRDSVVMLNVRMQSLSILYADVKRHLQQSMLVQNNNFKFETSPKTQWPLFFEQMSRQALGSFARSSRALRDGVAAFRNSSDYNALPYAARAYMLEGTKYINRLSGAVVCAIELQSGEVLCGMRDGCIHLLQRAAKGEFILSATLEVIPSHQYESGRKINHLIQLSPHEFISFADDGYFTLWRRGFDNQFRHQQRKKFARFTNFLGPVSDDVLLLNNGYLAIKTTASVINIYSQNTANQFVLHQTISADALGGNCTGVLKTMVATPQNEIFTGFIHDNRLGHLVKRWSLSGNQFVCDATLPLYQQQQQGSNNRSFKLLYNSRHDELGVLSYGVMHIWQRTQDNRLRSAQTFTAADGVSRARWLASGDILLYTNQYQLELWSSATGGGYQLAQRLASHPGSTVAYVPTIIEFDDAHFMSINAGGQFFIWRHSGSAGKYQCLQITERCMNSAEVLELIIPLKDGSLFGATDYHAWNVRFPPFAKRVELACKALAEEAKDQTDQLQSSSSSTTTSRVPPSNAF